jgi:uncharacterized membrane protein
MGEATAGRRADLVDRVEEAPPRWPRWLIVATVAMALALVVSGLIRYRFYLSGFDQAFFEQKFWLIARGQWTETVEGYHVLGDHFAPIVVPLGLTSLLPWPGEALMVLQGVVVAAGLLPAYRLGTAVVGRRHAWLGPLWYGLSVPLWYALFDFHTVVLGVPVLVWMMWRVEATRVDGRALVGALVVGELALVLCREDLAILGAAVIGVAFVRYRRPALLAVAAAGGGIGLLYLQFSRVILGDGAASPFAVRYHSFGDAPGQLVAGLPSHLGLLVQRLTDPVALSVYLCLFLPMVGLAFVGWRLAWPGFVLMLTVLISDDELTRSVYFQYHAAAVPFLIWGGLTGFRTVVDRGWVGSERLTRGIVLSSVALFVFVGPVLAVSNPQADRRWPVVATSADRIALDDVVAHAPPGVELSASGSLAPHVADRSRLYVFPMPILCEGDTNTLPSFTPDWVLLERNGVDEHLVDLPALGYQLQWSNDRGELWRRVAPPRPVVPCNHLPS